MEKNNDINKSVFWEQRYEKGEIGWDLGAETPVFTAISEKLKPGKVCILGCGNGYDAISFSKKGFSVTAVDFARTPINNLQIAARSLSLSIETIKKDIFDLIPDYSSQFDYIIEQTCFCAIDPRKRQQYSNLVLDLLKVGGKLIGLWMPLDKNIIDGGPPFGVKENEIKKLFSTKWKITEECFPTQSIEARKGREKLIVFEKL
mgnify:FL=1